MESKRATLTKAELLERVHRWVDRRGYGFRVSPGWLEDLLKDGLVPAATRGRNSGRSPVYTFDYRAYRVALQIARLRHHKVVKRDEISVVLFRNGYTTPTQDVRHHMISVWQRHLKSMRVGLRSTYLDNWKAVPPSRKQALEEALGKLGNEASHAMLGHAGINLMDAFRAGSQRGLSDVDLAAACRAFANDEHPPTLASVASAVVPTFDGMLLLGAVSGDRTKSLDYIEALIAQVSIADLRNAAKFVRLTPSAAKRLFKHLRFDEEVSASMFASYSEARYNAGLAAQSLVSALNVHRMLPLVSSPDLVQQVIISLKEES